MVQQMENEKFKGLDGLNDAGLFVGEIQRLPEAYYKFSWSEDKVVRGAVWATREQKELALRFGSLIVLDTTFNSNR